MIFCGPYGHISPCQNFNHVYIAPRSRRPFSFFGLCFLAQFFDQISRDQIRRPISPDRKEIGARNLQRSKTGRSSIECTKSVVTVSPCGAGGARQISKKIGISKISPTLACSGGRPFRGFRPGPKHVVGRPSAQRTAKTGPAQIVQLCLQPAPNGPLSKTSPRPHPESWGPTPDFEIAPCGHAEGPQVLKFRRKYLRPFPRKKIPKFGRKFQIFRVRGILISEKIQNRCGPVPSTHGPNLVRIGRTNGVFKGKKPFPTGLPKADGPPTAYMI